MNRPQMPVPYRSQIMVTNCYLVRLTSFLIHAMIFKQGKVTFFLSVRVQIFFAQLDGCLNPKMIPGSSVFLYHYRQLYNLQLRCCHLVADQKSL